MNDEELIKLKTYKIKELCKKIIEDVDNLKFKKMLEVFEIKEEITPDIVVTKRIELDEKYLNNIIELAAEIEEFDYIINLLLSNASFKALTKNNIKFMEDEGLEEDSGVGKDE